MNLSDPNISSRFPLPKPTRGLYNYINSQLTSFDRPNRRPRGPMQGSCVNPQGDRSAAPAP